MKILAINISLRPGDKRKLFPIGLGYVLTAVKRAGYEFDLLDINSRNLTEEETDRYLRENRYDVVMMGCIVTGYKIVKRLVGVIKESHPHTTIIVGNSVASSIPDTIFTKTATDIIVLGEGDVTVVELLDVLQKKGNLSTVAGIHYRDNGRIVKNPPRPVIADINTLPMIDYDIFDVETYIGSLSRSFVFEPYPPIPKDSIRAISITIARGCPFSCTFCYQVFKGEKYRYRSVPSVINEMKECVQRYGINYFFFNDELAFFSIKQAEEFADALMESGMKVWWAADVRAGLFIEDKDVEVARKMKKAGCLVLGYAIESTNPEILKWMNKKITPEVFKRQQEILTSAGVASVTSIVIGYPNETPQSIRATIDFCIENNIFPSTGYLQPQPGTPMYQYAIEHGYVTDEEEFLIALGDRQDLRFNMTIMSDKELTEVLETELERCRKALGITLGEGSTLLKTGSYMVAKNKDIH